MRKNKIRLRRTKLKIQNFKSITCGYSLIEVIIAIVIFLFGILVIMKVFPAGINILKSSKDLSCATFLAQSRLEELLASNSEVYEHTGYFEREFKNYSYSVELADFPYNCEFKQIILNVAGPDLFGHRTIKVTLDALIKQNDTFGGITASAFSNAILTTDKTNNCLWYYKNLSDSSPLKINLPQKGIPFDVASDKQVNAVFISDTYNKCIWYYENLTNNYPVKITLPQEGVPLGVCTDQFSNILLAADKTNKCIWYYQNSTYINPIKIILPKEGKPLDIASDSFCNTLFATDSLNKCIWYYKNLYDTNPAMITLPQEGAPVGVCTDIYSNTLWVSDNKNKCLWYFKSLNDAPLKIIMPNNTIPTGITTDIFSNTILVNTAEHKFYYYNGFDWEPKDGCNLP